MKHLAAYCLLVLAGKQSPSKLPLSQSSFVSLTVFVISNFLSC